MQNRAFWFAVVGGVVSGAIVAAVLLPFQLDVALRLLPQTTRITSSGTAPASFGGSYQIASDQLKKKEEEFNAIRDIGKKIDWDSSTTRELDRGLFENSIKANSASEVPDARRYQRYNYVVKRGSIRVAIWTVGGSITKVCKLVPVSPNSGYATATTTKGVMVNFFPEDEGVPAGILAAPRKACPTPTAGSASPTAPPTLPGVLDAHSKHFMLAQDVDDPKGGKRLASLSDYVGSASGPTWKDATVDYAGEIIVDVTGCYYIINNGSGTYRPDGGSRGDFSYLLRVAQLFEEKVGVSPAAVWDSNSVLPVIKIPESGKPLRCA